MQPDTENEVNELRMELNQFNSYGIKSSPRDLLLFLFSLLRQNYLKTVSVHIMKFTNPQL
jgi:hypothetical protein